jgi:hypothetical protein
MSVSKSGLIRTVWGVTTLKSLVFGLGNWTTKCITHKKLIERLMQTTFKILCTLLELRNICIAEKSRLIMILIFPQSEYNKHLRID